MNPILLDIPTIIETPRLILRPPRIGDGKALHECILDGYQDFITWLNWPQSPPSLEEVELQARQQSAYWTLRTDMRFMCIRKEDNRIMGRLAYPAHQIICQTPLFGISYFLGASYQGKGYATEAVNALTRYAFIHFLARKVMVKCDMENPKSLGVPQRLNFEHEATERGIWPRQSNALSSIATYSCFDESTLPDLKISYR